MPNIKEKSLKNKIETKGTKIMPIPVQILKAGSFISHLLTVMA